MSDDDRIKVTRTVEADPPQLFALLSDPSRHTEFDGASMLRGTSGGEGSVGAVGDEFVMKMHNDALGEYEILNTVNSYEENREIGWAPQLHPLDGYTDKVGNMQAKGHTYTWKLEPAGPGQTRVTQVYDWSGVTDSTFRGFFPMLSAEQLEDSIERAGRAAS